MFKGPGAKKYDFSNFNPYVVGAIIFVICYLGSKNTYYDQFYRVSQLPKDRNEMGLIHDVSIVPKINQFFINYSMSYIFTVTIENFGSSISIILRHKDFTVRFQKNNYFDYQFFNNKASFYILSPVFGDSLISLNHLKGEIASLHHNITHINLLFPGFSLASNLPNYYHFNHVVFMSDEMHTFFTVNVDINNSMISLGYRRSIRVSKNRGRAKDFCTPKKKCQTVEKLTFVLLAPNDILFNFNHMFITLLNPIVDIMKKEYNPRFYIHTNLNETSNHPVLMKYLEFFNRETVNVISKYDITYFHELRLWKNVLHDFSAFRELIGQEINAIQSEKNLIVFVSESEIDNVKEIASKICEGCKYKVVKPEISKEAISEIRKAQILVTSKENTHLMFSLNENSEVYIFDSSFTEDDDWIKDMALNLNVIVKKITGNINDVDMNAPEL
ncbi:hypothetical protein TRFO_20066 [Tritrichomonas foetus]|uniref:Uncharacterized protein n=1 Tax=Tritrichomonas foetus TaxID=1144522 RepID=A0A1J4KMH8_9EUKA|nr:hypothetical protein TRFO_20066 [Tritrichomonas foetus]|eukprot:OHT10573.1 hypothetical protein TRFO_20066 [Tritrichomonas foetus]